MQECTTFTLTIDSQEMLVCYKPKCFGDYGHFEFKSPYEPARRIIISETGYRSHFSPMHEIAEAPSIEEYAHALAIALMRSNPIIEDDCEVEGDEVQFSLF